jgi:hypothetical protein
MATQVAFWRLNRNMPLKELDLFRSSAAHAEPNFAKGFRFAKSFTICPTACSVLPLPRVGPIVATQRKIFSGRSPMHSTKSATVPFTSRDWNRANVPCLAFQNDNGRMLFSLFQMFDSETGFPMHEQTACFRSTSLHKGFRLHRKFQKTTKCTDIRTHNAHLGWGFSLALPAL